MRSWCPQLPNRRALSAPGAWCARWRRRSCRPHSDRGPRRLYGARFRFVEVLRLQLAAPAWPGAVECRTLSDMAMDTRAARHAPPMRLGTAIDRAAASAPAPYAAAETIFAETIAYLCSREARQMSESDLELELQRWGRELMRSLLQAHLDQRGPGEAAGPVAAADGAEHPARPVLDRPLEDTALGSKAVSLSRARIEAAPDPLTKLKEIRMMLAERIQDWTREWQEHGRAEGLEQGRAEGYAEGLEQGRAEGLEQGRAEGYAAERSLLHRQAARKFRTTTADQLATAIADLRDPERLAEIGESIIDCSTATELLERVRIICRRQAAEQQD